MNTNTTKAAEKNQANGTTGTNRPHPREPAAPHNATSKGQGALRGEDAREKATTLAGALQGVEWLVVEAQLAVSTENPEMAEYLRRLQLGLSRAQGRLLIALRGGNHE